MFSLVQVIAAAMAATVLAVLIAVSVSAVRTAGRRRKLVDTDESGFSTLDELLGEPGVVVRRS